MNTLWTRSDCSLPSCLNLKCFHFSVRPAISFSQGYPRADCTALRRLINDRVRPVTHRSLAGNCPASAKLPSRVWALRATSGWVLRWPQRWTNDGQLWTCIWPVLRSPPSQPPTTPPQALAVWPRAANGLCRYPFVTRLPACHNLF